MTTIHIDLDDSLLEQLDRKLSARGLSVSDAVRQWLESVASDSVQLVSERRYQRELKEDGERWRSYQESGNCIKQQEMQEWLASLTKQAEGFSGK